MKRIAFGFKDETGRVVSCGSYVSHMVSFPQHSHILTQQKQLCVLIALALHPPIQQRSVLGWEQQGWESGSQEGIGNSSDRCKPAGDASLPEAF